MKVALNLLCVFMLLLSGARLALLGSSELRRYRFGRDQNALRPEIGSFVGIDAGGNEEKPNLDDNSRLVLFVIHHDRINRDLEYWNRVIGLVGEGSPEVAARTTYWGICDSGAQCDAYQSVARFTILGYLEPFEMRVVADADSAGDALVYDHSKVLDARIDRAPCPEAVAGVILQSVKQLSVP